MAPNRFPDGPLSESIWTALRHTSDEKLKAGIHALEQSINASWASGGTEMMDNIIKRASTDCLKVTNTYHTRRAGFLALATVTRKLGPDSASLVGKIVRPVITCLHDREPKVRFCACECMYNIAKMIKGEILVYFNDIFDALSKLVADSEHIVYNAADLLDQLMRDITVESASAVASMYADIGDPFVDDLGSPQPAFSLPKFIKLLQERLLTQKKRTRNFLINWIMLLHSVPGLDLVSYLPSFLKGLFRYLEDPDKEVRQNTKEALGKFLDEIKNIAKLQRELAEDGTRLTQARMGELEREREEEDGQRPSSGPAEHSSLSRQNSPGGRSMTGSLPQYLPYSGYNEDFLDQNDWTPGQNAEVNHSEILEILGDFLDKQEKRKELTLLVTLRWLSEFFQVSPRAIVAFFPKLLYVLLPVVGHESKSVRQLAAETNDTLVQFILALPEDESSRPMLTQEQPLPPAGAAEQSQPALPAAQEATPPRIETPTPADPIEDASVVIYPAGQDRGLEIDYKLAVEKLSQHLLDPSETTRVAALKWLMTLHEKSPDRILAIHDQTFPALLKTLSDPSEAVVTQDLLLLSQVSKNSDDRQFRSFMVFLLQLFSTDRKLLEARGNLIIRQLCASLRPERIYKTLAECLEKYTDLEFVSVMVQNLNNNLMTAPELKTLRAKLRGLDQPDGAASNQSLLFNDLYRSWCYSPVSTFALCLLAQAYEHAYKLLMVFDDIEMTVAILLQIDRLVQLIESPVFTYLRLQLLEPDRYPYLYKCLYGLLMLLPQTTTFHLLKNRLESVGGVHQLHFVGAKPSPSTSSLSRAPAAQLSAPSTGRVKAREDGRAVPVDPLDHFRMVHGIHRQKNAIGDSLGPVLKKSAPSATSLPAPIVKLSKDKGLKGGR